MTFVRPRRAMAVAIALVGGLAAAPAAAQQHRPADVAAAQSLFDEAKRLVAAGDYASACPKLEESERLDPGAGTEFNLADCYEHVGRTASAWAQFAAVADALSASGQASRAQVARERARHLEPRLVKLAIVVQPGARTPGLEVKRDGEAVGEAQWGTAVSVDPGQHVVAASAPGAQPWQTSIDVRGEGKTVSVEVPKLGATSPATPAVAPAPAVTPAPAPAPAVAPAPAPAPAAEAPARGSGQRVAGLVVGGVGVVGLLIGGFFGITAFSKHSDYQAHCDATGCDPEGIALHDDASSAATISTLATGVGLAAVAAGAVLYFTAPKGAPAAGVRAAPLVGAHGGGLSLQGAW